MLFPKLGDFPFFAFANCTFTVVAKTGLGPERALALEVHLVGAEVGGALEFLQDRADFLIKALQVFDGVADAVDVSVGEARCAFRWQNTD